MVGNGVTVVDGDGLELIVGNGVTVGGGGGVVLIVGNGVTVGGGGGVVLIVGNGVTVGGGGGAVLIVGNGVTVVDGGGVEFIVGNGISARAKFPPPNNPIPRIKHSSNLDFIRQSLTSARAPIGLSEEKAFPSNELSIIST